VENVVRIAEAVHQRVAGAHALRFLTLTCTARGIVG
jgi:hypothetical protein